MAWGINQEQYNSCMQMNKMRLIFNLLMMFIAYNGFAQNESKGKTRNIATFSNGDEAIEIISKTDKNVIKLTTTDDYSKYDILDLSNHEEIHKSSNRKKLIEAESNTFYMVEGSDKDPEDENENDDSSGA